MDESTVALTAARGRIAFGVLALVIPGVISKTLTGRKAQGAEAMFTRMWGSRDLALGLGAVVAIDHGTPVRGWLEGAATADAGDALSALLSRRQLSENGFKGTLAIASASAVLHVVLSRRLDPAPSPHPGQPEAVVTGHHEPDAAPA
jgi:hypothetical protein